MNKKKDRLNPKHFLLCGIPGHLSLPVGPCLALRERAISPLPLALNCPLYSSDWCLSSLRTRPQHILPLCCQHLAQDLAYSRYSADIYRKRKCGGTRVAQSVKHPTLGFGSGHDLPVRGIEPPVGLCPGSVEPAWDFPSLFLCLCPCPAHAVSDSLKIRKSRHAQMYTFV